MNLTLLATATPEAKRTLLLSGVVVAMLLVGAGLAITKHYRLHQWCQTAAVALNVYLVVSIMLSSYNEAVRPQLTDRLSDTFVLVSTIHGIVGIVTVLMGSFMVLRGFGLLPKPLRFTNYKPWMRTTLALYVLQTALGLWVFNLFYG